MSKVSIVMGSDSDWSVMKSSADCLKHFGLACDSQVVSAHRSPEWMYEFAKEAEQSFDLIIAGAGGAAHLPGMIASLSVLPVIGVPIQASSLRGEDALYSIVQMPKGVVVATVGINNAWNAGLLAVEMLSLKEPSLRTQLKDYKSALKEKVAQMRLS